MWYQLLYLHFYEDLLDCRWTADRFYKFIDFANIAIDAAQTSNKVIVLNSLVLILRYMAKMEEKGQQIKTSENCLFLTALRLSEKLHDDFYMKSIFIHTNDAITLMNMTQYEMSQFEFKFLENIDYRVSMAVDEFDQWESICYKVYMTFMPPAISDCYSSDFKSIQQQQVVVQPYYLNYFHRF